MSLKLSAGCTRFYVECWRRSRALKDLPGPAYGLFGILPEVRRGDIHRRASILNCTLTSAPPFDAYPLLKLCSACTSLFASQIGASCMTT